MKLPRNVKAAGKQFYWFNPATGAKQRLPQKAEQMMLTADKLNCNFYGVDREVHWSEASELAPLSAADIAKISQPIDHQCGIYFLLKEGNIVYVGQSISVHRRLFDHLADKTKVFDSFACLPCEKANLDHVEEAYIHRFQPIYNRTIPRKPEKISQ